MNVKKWDRNKNAGNPTVKRNCASTTVVHNIMQQHAKVKERFKCARGNTICQFVINLGTRCWRLKIQLSTLLLLKVNNLTCGALLDISVGSFYASVALLSRFKMKLIQKETKIIDMTMTSTRRKLEVYDLEISDLSGKFTLNLQV